MIKNWMAAGLGIIGFVVSASAYADTQTITTSQADFNVSPGDTIEFDVTYAYSGPSYTTGLGLKLYFDSSKLSLLEVSGVFPIDKIAQSESADSGDGDGDSATDKKLNVAWTSLSGKWPGSDNAGTKLYTIKFKVEEGFSSSTVINFTGDASAGNTFSASPVAISSYKDNKAAQMMTIVTHYILF